MQDEEIKICQMISGAGMAKSAYIEAVEKAKSTCFEEARQLVAKGDEYFTACHKIHAEMLSGNMGTLDRDLHFLIVHAEDQLMSAETVKILVEEIIDLYQIITKMNPELPY